MKLQVLGSGTALPYARRNSAGYAVRLDSGETVLVDCGSGVFRRASEAGVDLFSVRHIFLSHLHIDHVSDLAPILFAKRHPGLEANADLTIHGPTGLRALHDGLRAAYGAWVEARGFGLTLDEFDPESPPAIALEGATVRPIAVVHGGMKAVGYRFEAASGKVLAYSGDSGPCEGLVAIGRDADLLAIECSLPDEVPLDMHLTPGQVGDFAARAGARRILLTHLYFYMDAIDMLASIRRRYAGPVTVAEDLLEVEV